MSYTPEKASHSPYGGELTDEGAQKVFFKNLRIMSELPEEHVAHQKAFAENCRLEVSHNQAINDAISQLSQDIYLYE